MEFYRSALDEWQKVCLRLRIQRVQLGPLRTWFAWPDALVQVNQMVKQTDWKYRVVENFQFHSDPVHFISNIAAKFRVTVLNCILGKCV